MGLLWVLADAPAPSLPRLAPLAGASWVRVETLRGEGTLTRYRDGREESIPVTASAAARREWAVVSVDGERFTARAVCVEALSRLTCGDEVFEDRRPWRSFELDGSIAGYADAARVVDSPPAEDVPEQVPRDLPLELDFGELFCLLELGMLPPEPLVVGQDWSLEAAGGPAGVSPLKIGGRLVEVNDGEMVLRTRYEATIPDRPTPDPNLVARGLMRGEASIWFDRTREWVRKSAGPLHLEVVFARPGRGGSVAARLTLDLELTAEPPES